MFWTRVPIYTLAIYPAVSTLQDRDSLGQMLVFEGPAGEQSQIAWHDKFALTLNQERHLAHRVLHHLLRVSGCDIGWTSLRAFSFIPFHYRDRGWWSENLDYATIDADIAVQTRQPDTHIYSMLHILGVAQESVGRYQLAAEIYGQVWRDYASSVPKKDALKMLLFQGRAYKANAQFEDAEAATFMGLHELVRVCGEDEFIEHSAFPSASTTLMQIYDDWKNSSDDLMSHVAFDLSLVLLGLFTAAAFRSSTGTTVSPKLCALLRSQYRTKTASRKALLRAFQCDSVRTFREALIACRDDRQTVVKTSAAVNHQAVQKTRKEEARDFARRMSGQPMSICDYTDCPTKDVAYDKIRRCGRCKSVRYCSEQC
jgi:hypothetical protein